MKSQCNSAGLLGESLEWYPEQNEAIDGSISCCPGSIIANQAMLALWETWGSKPGLYMGALSHWGESTDSQTGNPFRTDRGCLAFRGVPECWVFGLGLGGAKPGSWPGH